MADDASESTPLVSTPSPSTARPKAPRSVTFNANPVSDTFEPEPHHYAPRPAGRHPYPINTSVHHPGLGGPFSAGAPVLSTLNSKLRRRNSHGSGGVPTLGGGHHHHNMGGVMSPHALLGTSYPGGGGYIPKVGPQRSTKNAQKLKLLPNPDPTGDDDTEEREDTDAARDVYSQYMRIKDPSARRDAARLGKADRQRLPRVTAYCTANKYQMDGLMRFLKGRGKTRGANPKLIDECIYTPYNYSFDGDGAGDGWARRFADIPEEITPKALTTEDERHPKLASDDSGYGEGFPSQQQQDYHDRPLTPEDASKYRGVEETYHLDSAVTDSPMSPMVRGNVPSEQPPSAPQPIDQILDTHVHTPEVFLFDYGVVVIWGMSEAHEAKFLKELERFEMEKLAMDEVQTELFNYYYTREYQPRIYNDFITLRDRKNYRLKLAISHGLAQSVKTSLFEELVATTIEQTKDIPSEIALTGTIALTRAEINMQIGELFILRINIHQSGSVLDTPELFWVEPQLEPVYQAVRSYLEMDRRVKVLTSRLEVVGDLLAVLKDQLSHGHGEKLEWIVIILIGVEILVAAINIYVDLFIID